MIFIIKGKGFRIIFLIRYVLNIVIKVKGMGIRAGRGAKTAPSAAQSCRFLSGIGFCLCLVLSRQAATSCSVPVP